MRRLLCVLSLCVVMCAGNLPSARALQERGRTIEAGEVLLVLNEQFLNALLEAMLASEEPLKFPLTRNGGEASSASCASEIVLLRESSGARTALRFAGERIEAPVAFRGSYRAPVVGCMKFEGWAETSFTLAFERERQILTARLDVRAVHLKRVPSFLSEGVTALVQETIDRRINPIEILRSEQLSARLPLAPNNSLRLRAREVRHQLAGKELRLRIFYEVTNDR